MEWQDEGFVLSVRRHGETDAVIHVLTRDHGRHAGLVRGGAGRRLRPLLQPGNRLGLVWRARLADNLGHLAIEPIRLHAGSLLESPERLAALGAAVALVEQGLGERDPHPCLFEVMAALLLRLETGAGWPADYVRFELVLLAELGFGLDLESCAVTGAREGLAFVSPRTGRAVTREAAGAWAERLLPLPGFLAGEGEAGTESVLDGLRLTGHFLARHLLAPHDRPLPPARDRLVALLTPDNRS